MTPDRQQRHLVAILYADVVGFSRMSEADEEGTFLRVRDFLDHFAQTIVKNNGEVIKYAGDAVLAIFNSATDALICAAQVQADTYERNQAFQEKDQVQFRIGLNLGDVIKDRGDVFGDGVNVAARLEALAKPGGICVSGSLYDAIAMKLPFDFEFMGEQQVKNISKPIRAYHASLQPGADTPKSHSPARNDTQSNNKPKALNVAVGIFMLVAVISLLAWYLMHKPQNQQAPKAENITVTKSPPAAENIKKTIIVMPFDDLSSHADQAHFVDGITEDIITDLSRLSDLRVLARNTSFRYKEQSVSPEKIRKDLGVSHMLNGSVRKAGNRLRITAELVDTSTGHQLWAERYDRNLTDIFAVQDDVTGNIVDALAIHLSDQDKQALGNRETENVEAYELFLKGQKLFFQREKEANILARDAYRQAITLDPSYSRPYGALAVTLANAAFRGWDDSGDNLKEQALELARKAVSLDDLSPHAYWALSYVHLNRKEYSLAAESARQAVKLSPSYADGYALLAFIYNYIDKNDEAIELIKIAMLLNPHYTFDYPWNLGLANYLKGNYEEAITHLQEALNRNPNALRTRLILVASNVALGRQEEAEWEADQIQTLFPNTTLSLISRKSTIANKDKMKEYLNHLRLAGLPE